MKPFKNPRKYQGGWAWVWPAVSAAVGWVADNWQRNTAGGKAQHNAQREAYGSIMGKVEAAKAAGIHPSVALGSMTGGPGPGNFTSDFSGIDRSAQMYSNQRQYDAEKDFQKAQASDARNAANRAELREAARTNADLARTKKEMDWLDEQIRASEESRLRENLRYQKSAMSTPEPASVGAGGPLTKYIPHEVTRHTNGVAQGVNPSESQIMLPNGEIYNVPFGAQAETSEIMNTVRDLSAHYGIPLDVLTGARYIRKVDKWMNNESIWDKAKRRYHQWRYPNLER